MNQFIQQVTNFTETANGALTHISSLDPIVDLFSMGVSTPDRYTLISRAWKEDPVLTTKVCFYLRDVRSGQGSRDLGRAFHTFLISRGPSSPHFSKYIELLKFIPTIGCWKDLYELFGYSKPVDNEIIFIINNSLSQDNLCAKWFPINKSLPSGANFHKAFADAVHMSLGDVRRMVVKYRTTVEQEMSDNQWPLIRYESVPSKANRKYSKAFLRNDPERRQAFLDSIMESTTTMKASTLYPHEIASMSDTSTADALWKSLPNYMEGLESMNVLPVIDTSGSMFTNVAGTSTTALSIATSLGIYFSEHNQGAFKDVWCNFSSTPKFYKLKGSTLTERTRNLDYRNWGMSTNIQAVFELILATECPIEDMPKVILVVSDMEFDRTEGSTNWKAIKQQYANAGKPMPVVVFWRVDVKVSQQPVTIHDSGTILINGYSPSFMKLLLSMDLDELKSMTPQTMMLRTILPLYSFVDEIFSK